MFGIQHHRNNMDVKVRVLYAWPNDQLSPDLADLWPNEICRHGYGHTGFYVHGNRYKKGLANEKFLMVSTTKC